MSKVNEDGKKTKYIVAKLKPTLENKKGIHISENQISAIK